MNKLQSTLLEFGANPDALHLFEDDGPALLPYATIINARGVGDETLGLVGAVYEWQDAPLLFLIDAGHIKNTEQLHRLRRLLAMRGDAPYLGVVAPGRLDVYRLALDSKSVQNAQVKIGAKNQSKIVTLAQLGNSRPQAAMDKKSGISNVVLNLLTGSITSLIELGGVSGEDAISLVGRALFTRFLADRHLLPDSLVAEHSAAQLFDRQHTAHETSIWLDNTFNGDMLPLSENIFATLSEQAFQILGDVLRKAPDGQLFLGWEEKWDNLDFAHIPVGVLSQAYELFLRNHAPLKQRREGGYYTPRPIADLMVRASFRALQHDKKCSNAKVLDPAAGAGVFLLTAFRELVAERWRVDGKRPDTKILRSILYNQIVGFDINEAALRFAALGLYLMSIELDPVPKPVDKLKFKNLRGKVLNLVAGEEGIEGYELGSLGPLVGDHHRGKYDIVIGNPPWASGTKLSDWNLVQKTVGRIATERKIRNQSPPLPNEVLDIPFVWRAMEWAKPGGQIAFALHARLLFQQGDGMPDARLTLFEALDVTSIINGVDLRQTKVWPEISAPFCLLIATNRNSNPGSGFRLISPRLESSMNNAGCMRIDALAGEVVLTHQLAETPEILKILFRGTKADLGIVQRIRSQGHQTLDAFWREALGVTKRNFLMGSGTGYQRLIASSEVRKGGDGLPGVDAAELNGRPEISVEHMLNPSIDNEILHRFSGSRMHRKRDGAIFQGPLAIVHKSPPAHRGRIQTAASDEGLVYSKIFYGYSAGSHRAGNILVRYLALVLGSKFALWLALMTSGEFGFEREVVEKAVLDRIPLPDFRKFTTNQLKEITSLFDALTSGEKSWEDVDQWVASLYGLGERDLKVISDTLKFNLPYSENKSNAQALPDDAQIGLFCKALFDELLPWCKRLGSSIVVKPTRAPIGSPWQFIEISISDSKVSNVIPDDDLAGLLQAADDSAASEMLIQNHRHQLLTGRLAQRRYWSETQARLLAQRIVWSHIDFLKGGGDG